MQQEMDKHVTAIGILYIIYFGFALLVAALIFSILSGTGLLSGNPDSMKILTLIGSIVAAYVLLVSLPGLIVGIGVLKRQNWARILAIIVGALNLLNIPFGTALGIYTIWVMTHDQVKSLFERNYPG